MDDSETSDANVQRQWRKRILCGEAESVGVEVGGRESASGLHAMRSEFTSHHRLVIRACLFINHSHALTLTLMEQLIILGNLLNCFLGEGEMRILGLFFEFACSEIINI